MSTAILSESESHLRQAQKLANIASWKLDIISGDLSWSNGAFDIFDIAPGTALTYEDFLQMILAEDREYVDRQWQAALNGDPYDIEHRIRVWEEIKWVREKAALEFDKKGRAIRAVGIVQDITDQKELENELRRAKINYRMIADYAYDWEWWMKPDDTFKYMSPACERITGYKAEKFVENYSLLREIIVPEDRDKWDKHDDGSHKDSGLQEMQFRIKRLDGEVRWIEHACQPVFSRENEFLGFRASNRDITERKQAKHKLQVQGRHYRYLVGSSLVGVFSSRYSTGEFVFVNAAMAEIYGFESPEQMLGEKAFTSWKDPKDREHMIAEITKTGNLTNYKSKMINRTGHEVHVLFSAKLDGDIISGMALDITMHEKTEAALKVSEVNLIKAQEAARIGCWDFDLLENNLIWTDENYKIFGIPKGTPMTYEKFLEVVHPEDRDYVKKKWSGAIEGEPYDIEHRLLIGNELKWVREKAELRFDDKGNPISGVGIAQDITEQKLADFQLEQSLTEIKKLKNLLEEESSYLRQEISVEHNYESIIGSSDALKYVLFKVEQVSETDTNVLVLGETGTGKELIARAIHNNSARNNRPLIKINCATLPSHLIESELFGHEKGSFTSADSMQKGRFEIADGSSLFLDEIGELPLELQPKLLRVIEDGTFERLGSSKTINVDVRIISATNRDLEKDVSKGLFRKDLWYRLNVFPVTLPPLRERVDDIPLLAQYYLDLFSKKQGKHITSIPARVIHVLQNYNWPGNVRELTNIIERAVISTSGSKLQLAEELKQHNEMETEEFKSFHDMERDYIIKVLEKTYWKVSGTNSAAEILGLDRSTLRNKIKKLDIRQP